MERPSPLASLWYGLAGGLCAGSMVGAAEALYVLSASKPAEYQALLYGVVLYGAVGALLGIALGVVLAVLGRIFRLSAAVQWCLGFFGVGSSLAVVIFDYILDKALYAEEGVPTETRLAMGIAFALLLVVGTWFGGNLLTKTPLRALVRPKGTLGLWGAGLAVAIVLSMTPAPGAAGEMALARPQDPAFAQKPDVILLLLDTTRADALGVYGAGPDASPNIDAFAKDAVVFDQHVTSASWTRASTASLFTSLAPSSHGCETKNAGLSEDVVTLAEVMRDGGYVTGGLPDNANVTGAFGFDQGFDWFPYAPEYPLGASESSYALSMYSVARKLYAGIDTNERVESYYSPAETQLERAEAFLNANANVRTFLFVHLMEPHDPYFVHPWTGEAYGRAESPNPDPTEVDHLRMLYAGEVKHADEEIGKFLAKLKADGRYEDALIVLTSDHGEEFLDHGGWWHGTTLYDEQIHVPLIVKLPRNERAGTHVPWQVRQLDVAPTIVDIAGFQPDPSWQGQTLFDDAFDDHLAMLSPPEDPDEGEPPFVPPTWANHPASRDALSEQDFEGYVLQSLRGGGKKIIQAEHVPVGSAQPPEACYDLLSDRGEHRDLKPTGGCDGAMAAHLQNLVEDAVSKRVHEKPADVTDADGDRAEALGYATPEGEEPK